MATSSTSACAIECLHQKEVLPFLNPADETKLEYDVARSIQKVSLKKDKPVIGMHDLRCPCMGSGGMMPIECSSSRTNSPPGCWCSN